MQDHGHQPPGGGGIVGAAGWLMRVFSFDSFALNLVVIAGIITILKKAGVPIPDYGMWFAVTLGIAALLYEMSASKDAMRSWYNGRAGGFLAAGFIWACAFGYSVNQWIGAASENQVEKTNVHRTAFLETKNSQDALAAAKEKAANENRAVETARKELWAAIPTIGGQQVQTVEEVDAALSRIKADSLFTSTRNCTDIRGPKRRALCDKFAEATAARPKLEKRAALQRGLEDREASAKQADADLVAAELRAGRARVETSEARGDLILLTKWGGLSEEDAATWQGLGAIVAVSIFLSFGSMRSELRRLQAEGPRKRFGWGLRLRRWFCRWFLGREPSDVTVVREDHVHVHAIEPGRHVTLSEAASRLAQAGLLRAA